MTEKILKEAMRVGYSLQDQEQELQTSSKKADKVKMNDCADLSSKTMQRQEENGIQYLKG